MWRSAVRGAPGGGVFVTELGRAWVAGCGPRAPPARPPGRTLTSFFTAAGLFVRRPAVSRQREREMLRKRRNSADSGIILH